MRKQQPWRVAVFFQITYVNTIMFSPEFQEFDQENQQSLDFYAVPDLDDRPTSSESLSPKYLLNLSTRTDIKDKANPTEKTWLGDGWQKSSFTLEDLRDHIKAGFPFTTCLLNGSVRGDKHFESASAVFVDIDNKEGDEFSHKLNLEEALALPFIQSHAAMIYTSASHTDDWNRFRVVFLLPHSFSDPVAYKQTILDVCSNIPGYDRGATSVSNVFYGNSNALFPLFNPDARLDIEALTRKIPNSDKTDISDELSLEAWGVPVEFETLEVGTEKLLSQIIERSQSENIKLEIIISKKSKRFLENAKSADHSKGISNQYRDVMGVANFCSDEGILFDESEPLSIVKKSAVLHNISAARLVQNLKKINAKECVSSFVRENKANGRSAFIHFIAHKIGLTTNSQVHERIKEEKWIKDAEFNPDIQICERRVPVELLREALNNHDMVFVNSVMDTGKTFAVNEVLKDEDGILSATYRISLSEQWVEKFNKKRIGGKGKSTAYDLKDARELIADGQSIISFCINSLNHFCPADFIGKTLIIDEVEAVVSALGFAGTLSNFNKEFADGGYSDKGRLGIVAKFKQMIMLVKDIIVLDGNLTDLTRDWLISIRKESGKPVSHASILNTYQTPPRDYIIPVATAEDKQGNVYDLPYDSSLVSRHFLDMLQSCPPDVDSNKSVFISDSKAKVLSITKKSEELGFKGLAVCSETIKGDLQKQFCAKSEDFVDQHSDLNFYAFSPSVDAGIDVPNKNTFRAGFAILNGILETNSNMQFFSRVRDCKTWWLHISPRCQLLNNMTLDEYEDAGDYFIDHTLSDADVKKAKQKAFELSGMVRGSDTWNFFKNRLDNLLYERNNVAKCIKYRLRKAGNNVREIRLESDKEVTAKLKKITDDALKLQSNKVVSAANITKEDEKTLREKIDRSEDEQLQIDKYWMVKNLGGDADSPLINEHLCYDGLKERGHGDLRKMQKRVQLLRAGEYHQQCQRNLFLDSSNERKDYAVDSPELKRYRTMAKIWFSDLSLDRARFAALVDLVIWDLVDGEWHDSSSDRLLDLVERIKANPVFLSLLGRGFASKDPKQWMSALMKMLRDFGFRVDSQRSRLNAKKREYQFFLSSAAMPTEAEKDEARKSLAEASGICEANQNSSDSMEALSSYATDLEKREEKIRECKAKNKADYEHDMARLEANFIQLEYLEAGINKAFDITMENIGDKINDQNFDKDALLIQGLPHYLEWATKGETEAWDHRHKEARGISEDHLRRERIEELTVEIKATYKERNQEDVIAVSATGYSVTKTKVERKSFADCDQELTSPEILKDVDYLDF